MTDLHFYASLFSRFFSANSSADALVLKPMIVTGYALCVPDSLHNGIARTVALLWFSLLLSKDSTAF